MLRFISYFILFLVFNSCSKEIEFNKESHSSFGDIQSGWDVPADQIVFSSFPPDRIQSIDHPHFEKINAENLQAWEIAYVYRHGDIIKIYPKDIIAVHEIINDQIDEHYFAISLCPLTGSAIAWNREIDGLPSEFGVSGHLYNSNLIPYDRNTNSFWSQMQFEAIKGKRSGDILKSEFLVKTTGNTIFESFPSALVLVDTTGHSCDSICSERKKDNSLEELVQKGNKSLDSDYFGIIKKRIAHEDEALVFNIELFEEQIQLYQIQHYNYKMIVIGSKNYQFIIAFIDNIGVADIQFVAVQNGLPIIMKDNLGNSYDLTGKVIDGPRLGHRLTSPPSYFAHAFAWDLFFYNNYEIFKK